MEEIDVRGDKFGAVPVLVSYICENGCKPKRNQRRYNDPDPTKRECFEKYELDKIHEVAAKKIPYWYPKDRMMHAPEKHERWGLLWHPYLRGISHVCDFFTKRSLYSLSTCLAAINLAEIERDRLLFAFSGAIYNASRMYRERSTRQD